MDLPSAAILAVTLPAPAVLMAESKSPRLALFGLRFAVNEIDSPFRRSNFSAAPLEGSTIPRLSNSELRAVLLVND